MVQINLAGNYGWGPETFLQIFVIAVIVAAVGFVIVSITTRMKTKQTFASKRTYRFESYWAIGTAAILIWLWITSYPWMPPVTFSSVQHMNSSQLQVVHITAGQWFWIMSTDDKTAGSTAPSTIKVETNKPVKFIATSLDVNHGFGIFESKEDGSPILLQMQIVPGYDNIFYYTFTKPGTYFVRCLEYCGYAHPYMTTMIEVVNSFPIARQAPLYKSAYSLTAKVGSIDVDVHDLATHIGISDIYFSNPKNFLSICSSCNNQFSYSSRAETV